MKKLFDLQTGALIMTAETEIALVGHLSSLLEKGSIAWFDVPGNVHPDDAILGVVGGKPSLVEDPQKKSLRTALEAQDIARTARRTRLKSVNLAAISEPSRSILRDIIDEVLS